MTTTTNTEWNQIDSAVSGMSGNVGDTSSDLFGGDLFGDELLDMYNTAAVVGANESDDNNITNEIPSIFNSSNTTVNTQGKTNVKVESEGFSNTTDIGTFRPSTSFTDLTSILPLENEAVDNCASVHIDKTSPPAPAVKQEVLVKSEHQSNNNLYNMKKRSRCPPIRQNQDKNMVTAKKRNISNGKAKAKKSQDVQSNTVGAYMPNKNVTQSSAVVQVQLGRSLTTSHVSDQQQQQQQQQPLPRTAVTKKDSNKSKPVTNNKSKKVKSEMNNSLIKNATAPNGILGTQNLPEAVRGNVNTIKQPNTNSKLPGLKVKKAGTIGPKGGKFQGTAPILTNPNAGASNANSGLGRNNANASFNANATSTFNPDIKPTEETFKGVAQVAVSNLLLSASTNPVRQHMNDDDSDSAFLKPIDTTSAHVAALTSNNWVAACAAGVSGAPPGTAEAAQAAALAAASDPSSSKAARARRATLTATERARQNRDRNREHARNTRLRKKAYVEELKRTLTELVAQRDAAELEKRHEKQRDLEVREVRFRVMEEFLKLRARGNEHNLIARWVAILEDGFSLTLPKTDYRLMVHNKDTLSSTNGVTSVVSVDGGISKPNIPPQPVFSQVLRGPTECMEDASLVHSFFNNLGDSSTRKSNIRPVSTTYHCDRKYFFMDGVNAILDWTLSTSGVTHLGASSEFMLKGSMHATFSPASNKLICAQLNFDSGCILAQLKSSAFVTQSNVQENSAIDIFDPTRISDDTDALLDSLQMPQVGSISTVQQLSSTVSVGSADKGESSSDEDMAMFKNHELTRKDASFQ
mmetsp:Transcript_3532/g.4912  ORF Transcript_3532/g.4912 Transcript_3532/m.4912 type:complete len:806 (+) Transcript_3532:437-2854(+)|eukprot:CAMPEP_0184865282 /NCGR_PEP_ID=MMETSP0580-20130426/17511_1 /TAXON_ID=1118495 /ORGANISM="Dactyliosolen fragilissimus" /LENGTH=805 /DNA_ID=CAMNT_0027364407 /DNA_START=350 /DNA_END=2767 /DNA_ORIENTATION=-